MDPFDKLAQDIAKASSPFALGGDWKDIQAGFVALTAWKQGTDAKIEALEAEVKTLSAAATGGGP